MKTHLNPEQVDKAYKAISAVIKCSGIRHSEANRQPVTFMGLCQILNWDGCKDNLPTDGNLQ